MELDVSIAGRETKIKPSMLDRHDVDWNNDIMLKYGQMCKAERTNMKMFLPEEEMKSARKTKLFKRLGQTQEGE